MILSKDSDGRNSRTKSMDGKSLQVFAPGWFSPYGRRSNSGASAAFKNAARTQVCAGSNISTSSVPLTGDTIMAHLKSTFLIFALVLFFGASAKAQESTTSASTPESWRMEITSTGGFHGLGAGGISLSSTGQASVNNLSKSCNVRLPAERFEKLNREFLDWELRMRNTPLDRSDATKSFTLPALCCDLIQYTFRMTSGSANPSFARFSESWPQTHVSDSLLTPKVLLAGLFELRDSLLKNCAVTN
jgi:hypothetical protein